jgi:hypothetical protein
MKKHFIIISIFVALLATACSQKDSNLSDLATTVKDSSAFFQANVLGESFAVKEGSKNDDWQNTSDAVLIYDYKMKPLYLFPYAGLIQRLRLVSYERREVALYTPTIVLGDNVSHNNINDFYTLSMMQQYFAVGKKELTKGRWQPETPLNGFALTYQSTLRGTSEWYCSAFGTQPEDAYIEITESKTIQTRFGKEIVMRLKANCKMYDRDGKPMGDFKGTMQMRFFYQPK